MFITTSVFKLFNPVYRFLDSTPHSLIHSHQSCATLYSKHRLSIETVLARYPLSEQTTDLIVGLLSDEPGAAPTIEATATAQTSTANSVPPFISTTAFASEDCGECFIASKEAKISILQPTTPRTTPLPSTTPQAATLKFETPTAMLSSDETDESDSEIDPQQLLYSATPSVTPLKDRSLASNFPPSQSKPIKPPSKPSGKPKDPFSLESVSSPLLLSSPLTSSTTPPTTNTPEVVKVTSSSIKRKQQELFHVETKKAVSSNRKKKKKLSDIDDIFGELG